MAKAKPKPAPKPSANGQRGQLHVHYGDVSIGETTCRLGCRVSRGNLTVAEADRQLCGKRLTVSCMARNSGGSGQESLPGIESEDIEFDGIADVKRFGVGVKDITFGLTFAIESVAIQTLSRFAQKNGVVTVKGVEAIPEEPKAGGTKPGDEDGE